MSVETLKVEASSSPIRLLIVDDCANDAELLLNALRRAGMQVQFAIVDTPSTFSEALLRQTWDVITSDHLMPAFSAPEALNIAQILRPHIPFIVVSGETDPNLAVALMRSGAQDFVQKRHLERLPDAIKRALVEAADKKSRESAESAKRT